MTQIPRCFNPPRKTRPRQSDHPIERWLAEFGPMHLEFSDPQAEALAELMPLLSCGEQSAQLVFQQAADESADQQSQLALNEVEFDEARHDIALTWVQEQLPWLKVSRQAQRRAQVFYARLGRIEEAQQQFARIASLDASVTQIMKAMRGSELGSQHPFSILCNLIMRDEAKHVYVARHQAQRLNASAELLHEQGQLIRQQLWQMLAHHGHAFEALGVDLDTIHNKVVNS
ncbi:hypothetical protein [Paraferrimonas sedimenticola]|uniref:Uncharacterized protein n=1 Tax=Paraferrimonas sedimenticola TaxID=375674 RepID=A0AA37RT81_9GAMM|nr:hypothetical protein [Paraferrimonas sedimenticola]GLP95103.1 hypothetical protein GCM10007895_04090 [Paraferrimonas sedimenticola]